MASARKTAPLGPITDLHQEYGLYGPYLLTKRGTLIGAVELSGRDPDGLNNLDYQGLSWIARNIYQQYGDDVVVTQYYAHYDGEQVSLRPRAPGISSLLSKRRENFLNNKRLTSSRLVHFFEIAPAETLSALKPLELFKHLAFSLTRRDSREAIKRSFDSMQAIVVRMEDLIRQKLRVDQILQETIDKWSILLNARALATQELWAFCRFLSNLDPTLLTQGTQETVPEEGWDGSLTHSDVVPVSIHGMDVLAFRGASTRYARVCSVTEFSGREIKAGIWAANSSSPVRQNRNFVLMCRFAPFTRMQKSLMFADKQNEMQRRNFSVVNALRGDTSTTDPMASMKPAILERLKELGEAELVEDTWGMVTAAFATWDTDPTKLRETSLLLKSSANKSGLSVCWESAGLPRAWQSFLPAGRKHSFREIPFTTSQFGASSLLYRASVGQPIVRDMNNEEAQYIFLSADGTPFHYSPNVNGRSVVFGIGPIGTGKSFTKNSIASHFLKYGSDGKQALFRAIDIDPGTEPVAQSFGKDGRIFRIDQQGDRRAALIPLRHAVDRTTTSSRRICASK
jgi:type IV secretion system protein VirB4